LSILELREVCKSFGGLRAVNNLSLEVEQGEILGIIGPNGAGKTTLFNLITGFLRPDSGEIWFEGQSLVGLRPHQICRRGVARTFQLVKPFMQMTVMENVEVAALNQVPTLKEAKQKAFKTIEYLGLRPKRNALAEGLPLAHRKRLELARALATGPKILLLDEVMGGLNPTETDELIHLIRSVKDQGVTILLIEHVMRGVMALSERVMVLNYGEKITEGIPKEVVGNPQVIEAYLGGELASA
jgi:branched-chain amino acid transport system ATP-binding protein